MGIVKILQYGLQLALGIFGFVKQKSDQETGRELQAGADAEATVKEATDAKSVDARDAGLTHDELVAKLRSPTNGP